jgi:sodium/bile acid cotransporter 7
MLALLAALALASVVPCRGAAAAFFKILTWTAIASMFFLYGVRLSGAALLAGVVHWRLQALILACTFLVYPLLGLALTAGVPRWLPGELWTGVLFVCVLPSTVQSSIAFTSMAGGNVPAALCAATASNLLGTVLTPLLAALVLRTHGQTVSSGQIGQILTELLLPFVLGQLCRPALAGWATRHRSVLALTDRGSILLVVYTAFSAAAIEGIWRRLSPFALLILLAVELLLLAAVLLIARGACRLAGLTRADELAVLFCGSKKSLATGVPMANVLFAGHAVGMTVIPLMLFHQLQLLVASALAVRAARAQWVPSQPSAS